jgi:hypothetical protein
MFLLTGREDWVSARGISCTSLVTTIAVNHNTYVPSSRSAFSELIAFITQSVSSRCIRQPDAQRTYNQLRITLKYDQTGIINFT